MDEQVNGTALQDGGLPQGGPANPPPASAPASGDDYRQKFAGLVAKFDTLKAQKGYEKWEDVPALNQVTAWQQSHTQLAEVQNRLTTASGELEVARGENSSLKNWQAKVKAILEVDASLIDFVDDIPTMADLEGQKAAITSFQAKLAKRVGAAQPGTPARGAGVQVPPSSPPVASGEITDSADLYSRMTRLLQESKRDPSKRAEYEKLRDQWYAAN